MPESLQHQMQLRRSILNANERIQELNDAHAESAKAQANANPQLQQAAHRQLEQAERSAEEAREQLLSSANESQEHQTEQNLQELEDAMDSARQF